MESEQIWDKELQNLSGTEFTFSVMVTSWICLSLSLYLGLIAHPVMGLVLVAPLEPTQKGLSTQTSYTQITTVIYWCLMMQIAIASHQYHKPRKASTKLYIGLICFVLLILLLHEREWNIVDKALLPTNNCYAAFELSKYSQRKRHWFKVVAKESLHVLC